MATRLMFWRKEVEDAMSEERHAQPGFLSDFILGSQDGLVNVLGVLLGVAIASRQFPVILAAGLAATFAESISMGAVAYTSTLARRDHYLKEIERERREMRELPDVERREVREIFAGWGFEGAELEDIVDRIIANPKAWLELMMAHELNLAPVDKAQARRSGVLVGVAAIVGSLIPLAPFVALREDILGGNIMNGIVISLLVSAVTLFLIGWYKAKATVGRPARSGLQMLIIGIVAALAGFGIAYLVGVAGI
ncbi:MAG: VIT1/CCC1 transporter family protein [Methanobacteriota archaeon]